ncbi:YlbD family protein [Lentibacillus sp. N15]|uniref:YlbD family protein n=1 Tax=Lentibacillus songyuanensis TaxID=3136161 RepID=UPI0031BB190F
MQDNLHPSVKEFKAFLAKHPALVKEIRKNGKSWQEPYEKWALLGEDDPYWESYKKAGEEKEESNETPKDEGKSKQAELFGQLMKMTEKMDMNKVQKQVEQLSTTIGTVQEMISQFQESKNTTPQPKNQPQPFNWFRD